MSSEYLMKADVLEWIKNEIERYRAMIGTLYAPGCIATLTEIKEKIESGELDTEPEPGKQAEKTPVK